MHDPFHPGERAIQAEAGVRDLALLNGRAIADQIPAAALPFVSRQNSCVLGACAPGGDLWASVLVGPPGFARAGADRRTLDLQLHDGLGVLHRIPPFAGMRDGDHLGALFIELATRRRLRVNGRLVRFSHEAVSLRIDQAHALCPKYIQRRRWDVTAGGIATPEIREGEGIDPGLAAWIRGSDTFFVASADPDGVADVSHRGGNPGFVRLQDGILRIPDYPGNSLFNTLGNFLLNPRAGLVFLDFRTPRQLQITGDVRLDLRAGEQAKETGGTGRWWEFTPRRWIVSPLPHSGAWELLESSPFNPPSPGSQAREG